MAEKVVRFEETMIFPDVEDGVFPLKWKGAYIFDDEEGILEGYIEDNVIGLTSNELRRAWILGLVSGNRWCFCWFGSKDFDFPVTIRFFNDDEENGMIVCVASSNGTEFDILSEVGYSQIKKEILPEENTEAKEVIRSIVDDIKEIYKMGVGQYAKRSLLSWARFYYKQKTGIPW